MDRVAIEAAKTKEESCGYHKRDDRGDLRGGECKQIVYDRDAVFYEGGDLLAVRASKEF